MNIFDGIILLALLAGAYGGYRKGLLVSITGLISHVIGIVAAFFLFQPVGDWLNQQFRLEKVIAPLMAKIIPLPDYIATVSLNKVSFEQAGAKLSQMNLPELYNHEMIKMVEQLAAIAKQPGLENLGQAVAYLSAGLIISIGTFVLLTIVFDRVSAGLLRSLFSRTAPGMVKLLDRLMGLSLGVAKNTITVMVGLAVMKPLLSLGSVGGEATIISKLANGVNGSQMAAYFFKFLSTFNI